MQWTVQKYTGKREKPTRQTVAHCCLGTVPRLPSQLQRTEAGVRIRLLRIGKGQMKCEGKRGVRDMQADKCRRLEKNTNRSNWKPPKIMLNQARGEILREGMSIRKQHRAHWSFLPLMAVFVSRSTQCTRCSYVSVPLPFLTWEPYTFYPPRAPCMTSPRSLQHPNWHGFVIFHGCVSLLTWSVVFWSCWRN